MQHPLLTPDNHFDRAAILRRAWCKARNSVAMSAKLRVARPVTLREAFARSLRYVWDEARGARSLAIWSVEQEAALAHLATLDARTREIAELRFDRFAANGIDNARAHRAEVERIEARLLALAA